MKNKKENIVIFCFIVPLLLLALFYLFSPTDELSLIEKRRLQQRPEFSFQALADGSYSSDLDRFFTDQLPFREMFIVSDQFLAAKFSTFFGLNEVQLVARPGVNLGEGENLGTDGKALVTFPAATTTPEHTTEQTATPGETETESTEVNEPSVEETTVTSGMTETTVAPTTEDTTAAPTTVEPTAAPTAPPATTAPTPEATSSESSTAAPAAPTEPPVDIHMSGNILIMGDRAVEIFYSNQAVIDHYASIINNLAAVSGDAEVYNILAPTASQFYAPEGYRQGSSNQQEIIPAIYKKMSSKVKTVDAYAAIAPHQNEYIYFRTDHHWTGLGAYYAYTAFANKAGFAPLPLSSFTQGRISGDFLGTLYAWANSPKSLKENPDYVEYWQPPVTTSGYAFTDASMSAGYAINLIKSDLSGGNKYLAFTEGDHGLAKFETSNKNGRNILIIKESYGNGMVPLLAAHYENVYVFDPRKATISMSSFIAEQAIDDILIINYSIAIGNAGWKDALNQSLN